ncbi:hypothetical protein WISP_79543 [Willisornis vidua]|uniref:Uncharacterized protein n=1 Tax=Willisornis vidua TaxID=1566151 RepID=A0ABQ9D9H2_9PASS|nr:hypothetical protein WISP_79543 [Willisornis vidua]
MKGKMLSKANHVHTCVIFHNPTLAVGTAEESPTTPISAQPSSHPPTLDATGCALCPLQGQTMTGAIGHLDPLVPNLPSVLDFHLANIPQVQQMDQHHQLLWH